MRFDETTIGMIHVVELVCLLSDSKKWIDNRPMRVSENKWPLGTQGTCKEIMGVLLEKYLLLVLRWP